MSTPRQWTMTLGAALAFCVCHGVVSTTIAASDQATTLADVMARDFGPAKISTLIARTTGHIPSDSTDTTATLEKLQRVLNVGNGVAVALLHILINRTSQRIN